MLVRFAGGGVRTYVVGQARSPCPHAKISLGQGNKIFSSLDLLSGYWQMPLAPESREITAFSTPTGHFEWLRMPFSLKSDAITFRRMINTLFSDILGKVVYTYLEDLTVCSRNGNNHLANLEAVLLKLKEADLKAKLTKCEFLKTKITFLGHTVYRNGIHTLDDRILAIQNFLQLRTVENARPFIGQCDYYRPFGDWFAKIASHLNQLLKRKIPFHWNATQENSFNDLVCVDQRPLFSNAGL